MENSDYSTVEYVVNAGSLVPVRNPEPTYHLESLLKVARRTRSKTRSKGHSIYFPYYPY